MMYWISVRRYRDSDEDEVEAGWIAMLSLVDNVGVVRWIGYLRVEIEEGNRSLVRWMCNGDGSGDGSGNWK